MLEDAVKAGTAAPGSEVMVAKFESKAETLWHLADVRADELAEKGIKPKKHWRQHADMRWDKQEQAITEAAALAEWRKLGDLSRGEKVRMMTEAQWAPAEISAAI